MVAATKSISVTAPVVASAGIRSFSTIPEQVQAIQFQDWESSVDIFAFADGFLFVPKGYDHPYRSETERDRTNNQVLENAPAFLLSKAEAGVYRVDVGYWVVKKANGSVLVLENSAFLTQYQENQF